MSAFRFGLQKVLELRERSEKDSARTLAEARTAATAAEDARDALMERSAEGRSRITAAQGKGGPVGMLQNLTYVVDRMDDEIVVADTACREAGVEVERSRASFREAFKQRRTMDQLRARRHEEWRSEQARADRTAMDEIALTRHVRSDDRAPGRE